MWLLSNKVTVRDSGLMEGLCDYHCHLLPGVDDGVEETGETLAILGLWEQMEVEDVWLTPHVMEDIPNLPAELKGHFEALADTYTGHIRLHLASEHMLDRLFLERLERGDVLPLGEKRLLVETSYYNPPMDMEEIVARIKEHGYTPVLAHPERYRYMETDDYNRWKQAGMLLQLNIPSLTGAYGPLARKKAEALLDKGMYDLCGTDTHSLEAAEHFMDSKIQNKTLKKIDELTKG